MVVASVATSERDPEEVIDRFDTDGDHMLSLEEILVGTKKDFMHHQGNLQEYSCRLPWWCMKSFLVPTNISSRESMWSPSVSKRSMTSSGSRSLVATLATTIKPSTAAKMAFIIAR